MISDGRASAPPVRASSTSFLRSDLIRAYGDDPIACSTLQRDVEYCDTSYGFIAFVRTHGFSVTLGGPVCSTSDRGALVEAFFARARNPLFLYVDREVAELARGFGGWPYLQCGMGIERRVNPEQVVDLDSADPRVRGAVRHGERERFSVTELALHSLSAQDREALSSVTMSYLERSAVPFEMRFLNRPFSLEPDGLTRTFALRQGERLFGYATLDPYFREGRRIGELLNLIRFGRTRQWGVYYAVVVELARRLAEEGTRELCLGYSPLTRVDTENASPILAAQVGWMERKLSHVTYAARLRELKDAFPGTDVQRYFVTPSPLVPRTLFALVGACGVPLSWIFGPQLWKAFVPEWLRRR
jgi:lysylphosphatidylglycerol synthetase-like protein (DUF2156 family)